MQGELLQLRPGWTAIAERARDGVGGEVLIWDALPHAPLSVDAARRLVRSGRLLMAQRHHAHHVELVIRPAKLS